MHLAVILMAATAASAIEVASPAHAVDIAGKQRMYTQRMLKDYAMIGMGNTFGKPDEDLQQITLHFQDSVESLEKYTQNAEIKTSLEKVKVLWEPLHKTLLEAPSKEKVTQLQIDLDALLKASDETTNLFAKASGKSLGETVNKAGRQRMLSQRMASLYMLKVWEVEDPQFKRKLNESMSLFKRTQDELEISELNTEETTTLLVKVKRSLMFFEMMNRSKSKFVPTLIYKKSNDMLTMMDTVTQHYVIREIQ